MGVYNTEFDTIVFSYIWPETPETPRALSLPVHAPARLRRGGGEAVLMACTKSMHLLISVGIG